MTFLDLLYIIVVIAFSCTTGAVIGSLLRRTKRLEINLKKAINNINSLHKNQNVLVSSLRELHKELRKRDKSFKKQIVIPGPESEETGQEEVG